jgi:hypothetical protein
MCVNLHVWWRQFDGLFIGVFYAVNNEGTQEGKVQCCYQIPLWHNKIHAWGPLVPQQTNAVFTAAWPCSLASVNDAVDMVWTGCTLPAKPLVQRWLHNAGALSAYLLTRKWAPYNTSTTPSATRPHPPLPSRTHSMGTTQATNFKIITNKLNELIESYLIISHYIISDIFLFQLHRRVGNYLFHGV